MPRGGLDVQDSALEASQLQQVLTKRRLDLVQIAHNIRSLLSAEYRQWLLLAVVSIGKVHLAVADVNKIAAALNVGVDLREDGCLVQRPAEVAARLLHPLRIAVDLLPAVAAVDALVQRPLAGHNEPVEDQVQVDAGTAAPDHLVAQLPEHGVETLASVVVVRVHPDDADDVDDTRQGLGYVGWLKVGQVVARVLQDHEELEVVLCLAGAILDLLGQLDERAYVGGLGQLEDARYSLDCGLGQLLADSGEILAFGFPEDDLFEGARCLVEA